MEVLLIIVFIVLAIGMHLVREESHLEKINTYVKSIDGTMINFETGGFLKGGLGPFMVVGKGRVVYCIEYEVNGEKKEGWVRFGGLGGPDWRF